MVWFPEEFFFFLRGEFFLFILQLPTHRSGGGMCCSPHTPTPHPHPPLFLTPSSLFPHTCARAHTHTRARTQRRCPDKTLKPWQPLGDFVIRARMCKPKSQQSSLAVKVYIIMTIRKNRNSSYIMIVLLTDSCRYAREAPVNGGCQSPREGNIRAEKKAPT